ncbi:MAG: hypothetical protein E7328_01125 [Clostridiales bacterium]|nr:hypothetical protein [Clostridiales bacterium]
MSRFIQGLKKALHPHWIIVLLLSALCSAALIMVFVNGWEKTIPAYSIYTVSFYALIILSIRAFFLFKKLRNRLHQNTFFARYQTDLHFKAEVSIRISLGITVLFCALKSLAAIYYRSIWFGSVAFYYIILVVMRCLLFTHTRKAKISPVSDYQRYRLYGFLLFVLTVALSSVSYYAIAKNQVIEYPGFLIYGAAAFTFYNLSMAIYNLIRYRRLRNPIYSASKILAFSTALVSIFFLQIAMFSEFGDGGPLQNYMNITTGTAVYLTIVVISICMMRTGTNAIRAYKVQLEEDTE